MREALSPHPSPSSILQPRVPRRQRGDGGDKRDQPEVSPEPKGGEKRQAQSQRYRCRCAERRQAAEAQAAEARAAVPAAAESLHRVSGASLRGSAPSRANSDFFAASVPGAMKCIHTAPVAAPASGFAAPPAVRLCVGSSNGNDAGGSALDKLGSDAAPIVAAGLEFVGRYFPRPRQCLRFIAPRRRKEREGFEHPSGPPLPFSNLASRRQGDEFVLRRSGVSRAAR